MTDHSDPGGVGHPDEGLTRPDSWFNQVCHALGLFDGARPVSVERVLWDEVLPMIDALKTNNPEAAVLIRELQRVYVLWSDALTQLVDANRRADDFLTRWHEVEADRALLRQQLRQPVPPPGAVPAAPQIDGTCRNGAPHYCPNCDNSFIWNPPVAAVPAAQDARELDWIDRDLEEGFHQRDGWYFRREPNGAVRIWKVRWHTVEKQGQFMRNVPVLEAGPVSIPADEWESVVTAMAAAPVDEPAVLGAGDGASQMPLEAINASALAAAVPAAQDARPILVDRDAALRRELRAYLDTLTITGDNIGDIRRELFVPWASSWNGWVRDETAKRERAALPDAGGRVAQTENHDVSAPAQEPEPR